jgi:methyl-accepting chemotaxis protein
MVRNSPELMVRLAGPEGQAAAISKSQAVIQFELNGTIIDGTENFCRAMGCTIDEIRGKRHSLFVDSSYANGAEYDSFRESLRRGEYRAGEVKRRGKGGREIWIQSSYNPIIGPDGWPLKVVKHATDITDIVHARQEAEPVGELVYENLGKIVDAVSNASVQTASNAVRDINENLDSIARAVEEATNFAREGTDLYRSLQKSA